MFHFQTGSRRSSLLQIRASSSEETSASIDTSELFSDLKEKVSSKASFTENRCQFSPACVD